MRPGSKQGRVGAPNHRAPRPGPWSLRDEARGWGQQQKLSEVHPHPAAQRRLREDRLCSDLRPYSTPSLPWQLSKAPRF